MLLKIRIDKRVRYQGNGDGSPAGPPNYFQKLFKKYQTENCPDWLRQYIRDKTVRAELVCHREDALYHAIEAAKLEVRTSSGWHHKRNVGELQILGGRLAQLKKQASAESEIARVESEIRGHRSRRPNARVQVEETLELAQYHWHSVMFTVTEHLRSPGRYAFLPSDVIHGLCHWLSFPEIGIHCSVEAIRTARKHFSIDRRNGKSYLVYQYQVPRNIKRTTVLELENVGRLNEQILLTGSFKCRLCGQYMERKEIGQHLIQDEHIPFELIGLSLDPAEFYQTDTDETLAS